MPKTETPATTTVFAHVETQYAEAISIVSKLTGLTKRTIIETMIGANMGEPMPEVLRRAWRQYRAGRRP